MSITREDVARVARLAELAVADDELPALVDQMERIVGFVEQLGHVHDDAGAGSFVAGPGAAPLRDDQVRPAVLAHPIADMAPEFVDGFFAVPLRGGLEDTP
jgi:aspartyl-tRNA(Asn)/glutamyl-tRNA(Gln) amidotransferase subunit C